MESGQTPIPGLVDYLLASEVGDKYKNLKIVSRRTRNSGYYDQAVSKVAPDPAAPGLWEENLYSNEGQEPVPPGRHPADRAAVLVSAGTQNKAAVRGVPPAPPGGSPSRA